MLGWVNLHQPPCRLGGAVGVPTNRLSATEKKVMKKAGDGASP